MSQVKLDLSSMTAPDKASFAYLVGNSLIINEATFPDQPISGADLQDLGLAVQQAITDARTARATWIERVSTQNDMLATLDGYLRRTASYIQGMSQGDAAIIELAGLNVRSAAGSIGPLPAPEGFIAAPSSNPGTLTLKWKPVKRARSYVIQYAAAATLPPAFNHQVPLTRTKHVLTGLASGTKYWLRVAAISAAGLSQWTNAVGVVTQ